MDIVPRAPVVVRGAVDRIPGGVVPGGVELAPGLWLWPAAAVSEIDLTRDAAVALHGCGTHEGVMIRDRDDLQTVLDRPAGGSADALGSGLRGVVTAYVWRRDAQQIEVLPDPWGGLVHRHSSDIDVISSDLGALVEVLTLLGRRPEQSLAYLTEMAAAGSGGLSPSSYEGVEVLQPFEYLRVGATTSVEQYRVADDLTIPFTSYQEGLDAVEAEVFSNLRAVAAAGPELVAHLTGGLDTRMVLAAMMALGQTEQFRFASLGPATQPDRAIAERLAVEFDLTMTPHTGSTVTRMATSIGEQARWPMDFSHGLVTTGPHAHHRGSETVVLSGGYGGYMKGNYSSTLAGFDLSPTVAATSAMAEKLWGALAYSADPAVCLYTPQMRSQRVTALHAMRMAAQERGLAPDAALDWLFISVRNRYFVAETTRLWNAHFARFDPLYTLSGARLALSLPRAERSSTVVALDLMRRWAPQLVGLPFDRPKISDSYEELRGRVERRDFARPQARPRIDGAPGPHVEVEGQPGRQDLLELTPEMQSRATAMLAPLWQVRDLEPARANLRAVVDALDPALRQRVFTPARLHALLHHDLKHRGVIRQVHNLHATLLWLDPEQQQPRVAQVEPEPQTSSPSHQQTDRRRPSLVVRAKSKFRRLLS